MWRKEVISRPTYNSGWKAPEFHIHVNLFNFVPKKQEDKGSFVFLFYHMYFTHYKQRYPKSKVRQLIGLLQILVEK
jgi:hypothetical protein